MEHILFWRTGNIFSLFISQDILLLWLDWDNEIISILLRTSNSEVILEIITTLSLKQNVYLLNHLLRCWGWISILNWIGALTLSLLLKLPPRKLKPWLVLWSLFPLMLLCISIYLQYAHVQNTVATSELLGSPSLATSVKPLAYDWNVSKLSLFYQYYFGRCSSELAQLIAVPFSPGRSTWYSDILHDFSVIILRCYKDVYAASFFPCTAWLWNSLPMECFSLTYDWNGFKSRINRYILTVGSF